MPTMNVVIDSNQPESNDMEKITKANTSIESPPDTPPARTIVGGFSGSIYITHDLEDVEVDEFKIEILADAKIIQPREMKELMRKFKLQP
jgi:hypothetical protein